MNLDHITALLAKRFLDLRPTRDRFLKPDGSWMPRWRFAPFSCLNDAFLLLDRAEGEFKLSSITGGKFTAEVRIGGSAGLASGDNKAWTISCAIADAIG